MVHAIWQGAVRRSVDKLWALKTKSLARAGFVSHWHDLPDEHDIEKLHVLINADKGNDPVWVFIHGFSSQALDWEPLLHKLSDACAQVIAIDLPGHGQSPVPDRADLTPQAILDAAVDAVKMLVPKNRGCVLVGNSMGGLVTVRATQILGDLVRATVLISPFGAPYTNKELTNVLNTFHLTDYGKATAFVKKLFPNGVPAPGLAATSVFLWAHLNRPHLKTLREGAYDYPLLAEKELADMPPTLLVWGTDDFILPSSGLSFFRDSLPSKSTEVLTPARYNHMPFVDFAPHVANDIKVWAEKHKLLSQ
jgi:pimeloyl-ACP methyl ester carboxylesterase